MSFVEWVTALVLLAVALGGAYGGIMTLIRRSVDVSAYRVQGRGAILFALLYFAGGAVALVAAFLIFRSK